MPIDVTAERRLPHAVGDVTAYAFDWRHDHEWTQGIKRAELTRDVDGGLGVGAEVTRTAHFLGRRIDYVLRVEELSDEVLDMRSTAGPFPMHVTYTFRADPDDAGATLGSIRVRGGPGGLAGLFSPLMGRMVRRNLRKDLRDLEAALS